MYIPHNGVSKKETVALQIESWAGCKKQDEIGWNSIGMAVAGGGYLLRLFQFVLAVLYLTL